MIDEIQARRAVSPTPEHAKKQWSWFKVDNRGLVVEVRVTPAPEPPQPPSASPYHFSCS